MFNGHLRAFNPLTAIKFYLSFDVSAIKVAPNVSVLKSLESFAIEHKLSMFTPVCLPYELCLLLVGRSYHLRSTFT